MSNLPTNGLSLDRPARTGRLSNAPRPPLRRTWITRFTEAAYGFRSVRQSDHREVPLARSIQRDLVVGRVLTEKHPSKSEP
jgi:hypothetical protein